MRNKSNFNSRFALIAGGVASLFLPLAAVAQQTAAPLAGRDAAYGDWMMRCLELPNALPCDIVQTISHKETMAKVLAISIAYAPKFDQHAVQFILPLGIDLRRGVDIEVGQVKATGVNANRCEMTGCIVEAVIAKDMLAALASNEKGNISVYSDGQELPTTIEFSLKGFKEAEAALKSETSARLNE